MLHFTGKVAHTTIAEFANTVDLDGMAHNEPSHLDLQSLIFQHNAVYIKSFRNFSDIILLSAFLALYGLIHFQTTMHKSITLVLFVRPLLIIGIHVVLFYILLYRFCYNTCAKLKCAINYVTLSEPCHMKTFFCHICDQQRCRSA